jgi:DNA polymerase V
VNVTIPLSRPTADSGLLVGTAVEAVRRLHRAGCHYAKAGVMLMDLHTLASSGSDTRSWAVKRNRRTPRSTTHWNEMPIEGSVTE